MRSLVMAALAAASLAAVAQDEPQYFNSYKGKAPPELVSDKENWFNGGDAAITLEKLKGKVVWLEFSFIN